MKFMLEEYCNECDEVVHQVVDGEDFFNLKKGVIKCPTCGALIMPCNACYDADKNCDYCPFKNTPPIDVMSDEEYIAWYKENKPDVFEMMKNGELGDYWKEVVEKCDNMLAK